MLVRTVVAGIGGGVGLLLGTLLVLAGALRLVHGNRPLTSGDFERILVPVKIGLIGDEVLATAIKLAEDHGAEITALHVVRVPLDKPFEAELIDAEERAEASLAEAKLLAAELDVTVDGVIARARAIGEAIVEAAANRAPI